jgi:hypothetical protein
VRVSATRDGETVRLTAEDTGAGFDPAFLPRAFDPFARGPAEKAGPVRGPGSAWPSYGQPQKRTAAGRLRQTGPKAGRV